jgi:uncharacterized lipoprotein YmbA
VERNYFVIDYNPVPTDQRLLLDTPLPYSVEISDTRVSRVYDRSQIVYRYSAHKLEYSANDLWAVRLSSAIPDVLTKHFARYNTFALTQRDFLVERPDYELVSHVNRIELLKSEYYRAVSVNMDIFLRRGDDLTYLVRHSFDREYEVFTDDLEMFVQNLSRIIKEEVDIFIEKVLYHFEVLQDEEEE